MLEKFRPLSKMSVTEGTFERGKNKHRGKLLASLWTKMYEFKYHAFYFTSKILVQIKISTKMDRDCNKTH